MDEKKIKQTDVNMIELSTVTSWLHTDFDIFLGVAIGAADPTSLAMFEHYFERFQTTSEVSRHVCLLRAFFFCSSTSSSSSSWIVLVSS